uniref:Uncharacterized protein n=1 Tax=Picea glauca TaxID=3330 RepID=A0A101M5G1_PICGL|nr:hypothetical protein ABT39_MTgene1131 [Picea glauca]QHR87463.1 hypothetical protein Q903MT_gene1474 [Picea sitchensis]
MFFDSLFWLLSGTSLGKAASCSRKRTTRMKEREVRASFLNSLGIGSFRIELGSQLGDVRLLVPSLLPFFKE